MFLQIRKNIIFPQWIAGIGVTMLLIHVGFLGGWPSPTLARLTSSNSTIPLDVKQASWVASLINFSRFFGGISGSIAASYFGSKRAILVTSLPITVGWLLIVCANRVEYLYVARLSSGLGLGMAFAVFPLYIGEVSMPEIRGGLISLATVGAPFGQVISSIGGSYLSMHVAAAIYLGLSIILMIIFYWLPESPHHLVKIGDQQAARKSIDWYRAGKEVDKELDAVEKFVSNNTKSFCDKLREFRTPPIRKATFKIIALHTFMQTCGLNIIMFFMETILIRAKFTLYKPSDIVIYVNICSIFASAISISLIDRCGRRFLLVISSIGTFVSMIGLMSHFLVLNNNGDITNLQWLPMASMFIFMISFFIGLFPVPYAILSELFPANIKCVAACIAMLTGAIMAFLSVKAYQPMVDAMGEAYVFMIYAILSFIVIPYTLCMIPETKGKTLQQIQNELIK